MDDYSSEYSNENDESYVSNLSYESINKKIIDHQNAVIKDNQLIENNFLNENLETTVIKSKDAEKQEAEKAKEMRDLWVAASEDVATLGKKKTLAFKPKAERERRELYNSRIDDAKVLTKRATANTYYVRNMIIQVKSSHSRKIDVSEDRYKTEYGLVYDKLNMLNKWSFSTKNIKDDFYGLYLMVARFRRLEEELDKHPEWKKKYAEDNDKIRPLIEVIERRLKIFAEKNRIRYDGTVLGENEEGPTLLEEDVKEWVSMISAFKAGRQIKSDMDENTRLLIRKKKEELGTYQAKILKRKDDEVAVLTREQAMMTQSDILSQKKRDQLRDLNTKISIFAANNYITDLAGVIKAIDEYVYGTRYSVGYTEERKLLKKAIKVVDERKKKEHVTNETVRLLEKVEQYFKEMTNGTLKVDNEVKKDVKVHEDYMLEEVGNVKGKKRTKLYNGVKYMSNQENTPLFSHEPVVNDLKQRMVSNCFMMAATAGIINISPDLIKSCLRDNGDGTVTVRLYDKDTIDDKPVFTPRYYTMRKTIPRVGVGAASMDLLSAGCLWMQMIEKAFAFHGREKDGQFTKGYRSLWYGRGDMFIETLLGVPTSDTVNLATDLGQDVFWEEICNLQNNKLVFSTGTLGDSMKGLDTEHAYTILGGEVINKKKYVKMRNPYSNHSLQYKSNNKTTHSGGPTAFSNSSDDTYGQFYMTFDDFLRNFPNVFRSDLYDKVKTNTNEQLDDEKRGLPPKLKAELEKRERDIKEAEEKRKKEDLGNQKRQDDDDNDEDDF